jgi:hypothetical protein
VVKRFGGPHRGRTYGPLISSPIGWGLPRMRGFWGRPLRSHTSLIFQRSLRFCSTWNVSQVDFSTSPSVGFTPGMRWMSRYELLRRKQTGVRILGEQVFC